MFGLDREGFSQQEINLATRIFAKQGITEAKKNELKQKWEKRFGKKFPEMKFSINLDTATLGESDDGPGAGSAVLITSKLIDEQKENVCPL